MISRILSHTCTHLCAQRQAQIKVWILNTFWPCWADFYGVGGGIKKLIWCFFYQDAEREQDTVCTYSCTHTHCYLRHYIIIEIKPHEVCNKAFGRQSPGLCAFPTEQTTLSVRSKNNIKNTPSPVSLKFIGVASLAREALFGLSFYDSLSHKICLIRSPSLCGGRRHLGPVLLAC